MDQYRLAASGKRDGLWDWDLVSNRVHFSPRWVSMVGCEDGEVGNSPDEWFDRIHAQDLPRVRRDIEAHIAGGASDFDIQHRMYQKNGAYRWMSCRGIVLRDSSGAAVRLVGSHADVTADHVADPLTGLPNRTLFLARLGQSIERARRDDDFAYAVLLIDLDRPDPDGAAGQSADDPLLTASARRLEACLRGAEDSPFPAADYVVARLRGSQFALLLEGLTRPADAQAVAERVLVALLAPLQLRGRQVFPRASVGIALSATGYDRSEDAMRDADAALYRARSLGGNRSEVFDIDVLESVDARLALEGDLKQALEHNEFLLFYQPVLDAATNRIAGLEALVRWEHPARGMISPLEFIPIAEKTGFIVPLGTWILREACHQLKAWQESLSTSKDVWVSVNLSSVQFRQPGIVERVGDALRDAALDPSCLVLELTESVVMEDPAAVKLLLMQLRVMGVRIGIDDFGTGHSSFAYLHQFPVDFLKIDQSFIRGMEDRQDKADIVGTVAGLAGQLGLHVIAEGIESEAGLGMVRSRRCEFVQGFLFSRPVDADAAAEMLKNGVPPPSALADGNAPADAAPGAMPRAPEVSKPKPGSKANAFPRQLAYVSCGLAVALLLFAAGVAFRASRTPSVADPAPAQPSATKSAPPTQTGAAPQPPQRTPAAYTLAVVHDHVMGGCSGTLTVSPSGVSFTTKNTKDAFALKYGQFQSAIDGDTLSIKSSKKTWKFKAARAAGVSQNLAMLRSAQNAIAAFRPK